MIRPVPVLFASCRAPGRVHCRPDDAIPAPVHEEPTNVPKPVLRLILIAAAALVTLVLSGGCAKRHRIEIQSDTCWTSAVDNFGSATTNDCGNASFRVAGEIHCVRITNITDHGFVRVRIDDGAWAESTAPLGSAEACR
jgi:hypothetical protein